MKCHHLIVFFTYLIVLSRASPEAETLNVEELEAEHRSAKPEPFLDRLAAFFSGVSHNKKGPGHVHTPSAPAPGPAGRRHTHNGIHSCRRARRPSMR